jgi:hypothetical protein
MTQPIGAGVPLANAPIIAEPKNPPPYCTAPSTADAEPVRVGTLAKAPGTAIFLRRLIRKARGTDRVAAKA